MNQKYQLTNRQMSSSLGDEVVILNHKDGVYYGLEEVGMLVWEQLQAAPQTVENLTEKVCNVYDIEPSLCQADIQNLLADLIKEKLVEEVA
jgi:Coenzyme PQQ synthesis protein D (PqqD)